MTMQDSQHVVLYGGGLDSTALLIHLVQSECIPVEQITLLHINYGQKAYTKEQESALYWSLKYAVNLAEGAVNLAWSKASIMEGTDIGVVSTTNILELRNPLLLMYAASWAASHYRRSTLYIGLHQEGDEHRAFRDAYDDFISPLNTAIDLACNYQVDIKAPFSRMTRNQLVKHHYLLDSDLVDLSYSCYEATPCGKCSNCVEKANILSDLGLS